VSVGRLAAGSGCPGPRYFLVDHAKRCDWSARGPSRPRHPPLLASAAAPPPMTRAIPLAAPHLRDTRAMKSQAAAARQGPPRTAFLSVDKIMCDVAERASVTANAPPMRLARAIDERRNETRQGYSAPIPECVHGAGSVRTRPHRLSRTSEGPRDLNPPPTIPCTGDVVVTDRA
jgi:hypothetical protein